MITQKRNKILLNVWDTAGQEKFKVLLSLYTRGAQLASFVYDVTNRESLEAVKIIFAASKKYLDENCISALVGSRIYLIENNSQVLQIEVHFKVHIQQIEFLVSAVDDDGQSVAIMTEELLSMSWETVSFSHFTKKKVTKLQEAEKIAQEQSAKKSRCLY